MKKLLLLFILGLFSVPAMSQNYAIGDVLKGGVVFFVSANQDSVLICGKNDANQYCDWEEAKARCEIFFSIDNSQMMRGWRMPTKEEMKLLRERRDVVNKAIEAMGGIPLDSDVGAYYWTSSVDQQFGQAWLQAFGFDHQTLSNKGSNLFHARAVQLIVLKK